MKKVFFVLMLSMISLITFSQGRKREVRELKGVILTISPGFSFAYSAMSVKMGSDTSFLRFDPLYGKLILDNFQIGSELEFRARITLNTPPTIKKILALYHFQDELLAIKLNEKWILTENDKSVGSMESHVFLDKKVKESFYRDNEICALLFDGSVAAFIHPVFLRINDMAKIKVSDVVSFKGFEYLTKEGYIYPRWNPKAVYSFVPLIKSEGTIKSYLYKQNYVYIGLVLNTASGELQLSFPSDWGVRVKQFMDKHPSAMSYHSGFKLKDQLSPFELHALVSERDTLKIEQFSFYGGEDVKHKHTVAEVEGKITAINRSAKGKIISVILGNDCYIEVDYIIEKQLGSYLKKGNTIKVSGQERIKNEGEIYSKDYRIIIPREIAADGKIFVLNTVPY